MVVPPDMLVQRPRRVGRVVVVTQGHDEVGPPALDQRRHGLGIPIHQAVVADNRKHHAVITLGGDWLHRPEQGGQQGQDEDKARNR